MTTSEERMNAASNLITAARGHVHLTPPLLSGNGTYVSIPLRQYEALAAFVHNEHERLETQSQNLVGKQFVPKKKMSQLWVVIKSDADRHIVTLMCIRDGSGYVNPGATTDETFATIYADYEPYGSMDEQQASRVLIGTPLEEKTTVMTDVGELKLTEETKEANARLAAYRKAVAAGHEDIAHLLSHRAISVEVARLTIAERAAWQVVLKAREQLRKAESNFRGVKIAMREQEAEEKATDLIVKRPIDVGQYWRDRNGGRWLVSRLDGDQATLTRVGFLPRTVTFEDLRTNFFYDGRMLL